MHESPLHRHKGYRLAVYLVKDRFTQRLVSVLWVLAYLRRVQNFASNFLITIALEVEWCCR